MLQNFGLVYVMVQRFSQKFPVSFSAVSDPGGVVNLSWAGWANCKDTLKFQPCCVV